uniref:DUF6228 family protein n=1 Tax=Streptomyces megasporus TaxID=44060 RepID=UPI001FDEF3CA
HRTFTKLGRVGGRTCHDSILSGNRASIRPGAVHWDADLAAFVAGLAADYQGWEGERVWQTFDGDLAVSAVFRTGGHVGLTWTLRPWPNATGGWAASVTTWLEAGEQMSSLASDVEGFLSGEQP